MDGRAPRPGGRRRRLPARRRHRRHRAVAVRCFRRRRHDGRRGRHGRRRRQPFERRRRRGYPGRAMRSRGRELHAIRRLLAGAGRGVHRGRLHVMRWGGAALLRRGLRQRGILHGHEHAVRRGAVHAVRQPGAGVLCNVDERLSVPRRLLQQLLRSGLESLHRDQCRLQHGAALQAVRQPRVLRELRPAGDGMLSRRRVQRERDLPRRQLPALRQPQ